MLPRVQKFLISTPVGNGHLDLWFSRNGVPPMASTTAPAPAAPLPALPPAVPTAITP